LPPEVRRNQAARFAAGETEICVATDAVGMGLNLPADHVCFFEVEKFDGQQRRSLTANELRQIGGRAGRYGLSAGGLVGALNGDDLAAVRRGFQGESTPLEFARVAPSPEALAFLPGALAQKLSQWMELRSIPDNWRQLLKPVDVGDAVELAALLSPREVAALGEATALQLVRAPTDENTQTYWQRCAQAIVRRRPMPLPPDSPAAIRNGHDLQAAETGIRAADVYLWLSQRREFSEFGRDADAVRAGRAALSQEVDSALQRRIDTARRCRQCGRPLRLQHRFALCDRCHQNQRYDRDEG
jgi:ATP-dependent RNA helicase SUPV3L1/SUV3